MAAKRYVLLNQAGEPVNICIWDAEVSPDWAPPPGLTVQPISDSQHVDLPAPTVTKSASAEDKVRRLRAVLADVDKPGKANNVQQIATMLTAMRDALND